MAKPIGTIGNVPQLTVGGGVNGSVTFVDIITTPVFHFMGSCGGATNIRSGLFKIGSQTSSAYQITTGKTFTAYSVGSSQRAAVAEAVTGFGQADNAIGFAASTAATNPVFFGPEGTSTAHILYSLSTSLNQTIFIPMRGTIAAQKYGFVQTAGTASSDLAHFVFGYEA